MDHNHRYDGLEMELYQGMEVDQYAGEGADLAEAEKELFHHSARIYDEDPRSRLHRDLKTRQVAMIVLGGALGTGLIINT